MFFPAPSFHSAWRHSAVRRPTLCPRWADPREPRAFRLGLLAGTALLAWTAPGTAAAPPLNMDVRAGLRSGGVFYVRPGLPTPVRVTIENRGAALSGTLELRAAGRTTRTPVELPSGARREYHFYVRFPGRPDGAVAPAEVRLFAGRRTLRRLSIPLRDASLALCILAASGDGAGLAALEAAADPSSPFASAGVPLRVEDLLPETLPRAWAGYAAADVVVLNGRAWSRMDEEQRRALRLWIEQGGHAILCGGGPSEWRDPEGATLAGVEPRELRAVSTLRCVERWAGRPFHGTTPLLTLSGTVRPGALSTTTDTGRPLVVVRRAVEGWVVWLGFDPLARPFREWNRAPAFWQGLLLDLRRTAEGPSGRVLTLPAGEAESIRAAATLLPRLPAPSPGAIALFAAGYALLFGPLNLRILRWTQRSRRPTLRSWLLMPALALATTALLVAAGQRWGRVRAVLSRVTVLRADSECRTAVEESLVALFSPTNRAFSLRVEDSAAGLRSFGRRGPSVLPEIEAPVPPVLGWRRAARMSEVDWPEVQEDGVARWDSMPLELYSSRLFEVRRPRDLGGGISVRLREDGGGTVRNGSRLALREAYLWHRGRFCVLGDLPPGAVRAVPTAGWARRLPLALAGGTAPAGETASVEARFAEAMESLRREARLLLLTEAGREESWLVARADEVASPLHVEDLPETRHAALLLLRIPPEAEVTP